MKAIKKVRFALVCVSLMVAGISYAKIDLETCVGVWLFDEGKGNIASDSCENGSDGKIHGGAKWVGGKLGGKALRLDAKDDYTPNLGRNPLTDKPLLIGIYLGTGQHSQWGEFFSGIIDEVTTFNIALADDDIETIMAKGLEEILSVEPSDKLAAIWATIKAQ